MMNGNRMKKVKRWIFWTAPFLLLALAGYVSLPKLTLKVTSIRLINADLDDWRAMCPEGFDYMQCKTSGIQYKVLQVGCLCSNTSVWSDVSVAKFSFPLQTVVPPIVIGTKPVFTGIMPLRLAPKDSGGCHVSILINPTGYSDREILEMMSTVRIVAWGSCKGFDPLPVYFYPSI
jgi:hypothetical protein